MATTLSLTASVRSSSVALTAGQMLTLQNVGAASLVVDVYASTDGGTTWAPIEPQVSLAAGQMAKFDPKGAETVSFISQQAGSLRYSTFSGSGSGAASAFSVFGETGVASGASPSYAEETVATATTATAFSSVGSFSAYPGRAGVIVTNTNTGANVYLKFCAVSSTPTVSSTSFEDVVPPGTAKFFPVSYLVRIRWAHDSASTAGCTFTECY